MNEGMSSFEGLDQNASRFIEQTRAEMPAKLLMQSPPVTITPEQVRTVCRNGKDQTCSYLVWGGDGSECAKGSLMHNLIEVRRLTRSIRSMGDNCSGPPTFVSSI